MANLLQFLMSRKRRCWSTLLNRPQLQVSLIGNTLTAFIETLKNAELGLSKMLMPMNGGEITERLHERRFKEKRMEPLSTSKYRNQKVQINGITFDSKHEAQRYAELLLLQRAGEIQGLRLQVRFELIPKQEGERACYYIADFVYNMAATGELVVEDAKGVKTDVYKIKRKLMLWVHGIRIREV